MKTLRTYILCLFILTITFATADVALPKIIGDGMILQRGSPAPIWGWADTGEEITVEFAGQTKKALPGKNGKWMVKLDPLQASMEAITMTIRGKKSVQINNILVGEVWLASGQSNMEWSLGVIVPEELAYAQSQKDNPYVRAFHVEQHLSTGVPMDDTIGRWKNCEQIVSVPHQSISAVGLFFALKLQKELGIPIAIIDANWGGQRIEPFIPDEGYAAIGVKPNKRPSNLTPQKLASRLTQFKTVIDDVADAGKKGLRMPLTLPDYNYGWAENGIYNAMIAPLVPYALKGAIWYQGESNRHSFDYFNKLQGLSAGWSKVFNVKDIPLYQVQIAPYFYNRQYKADTTLCDRIWLAQYEGAEKIPGMGIVPCHDTNININDIHPRNKRTVGERLAAQALKKQYGKDVTITGPSFSSAKREGNKVIVSFKDIDKGLGTTDEKAPSWFQVSADNKVFVDAIATLNGNEVEVTASNSISPNFIRMGWADIAIPNLTDKNGWPVYAFGSKPAK